MCITDICVIVISLVDHVLDEDGVYFRLLCEMIKPANYTVLFIENELQFYFIFLSLSLFKYH